MTAAITDSILSDGLGATVSPSCTTGNCTWPQYTSLGVCSSCHDISNNFVTNSTCLVPEQDFADLGDPRYNNRDTDCLVMLHDGSTFDVASCGLNISTRDAVEDSSGYGTVNLTTGIAEEPTSEAHSFDGAQYPLASITSVFLAGNPVSYYPPVYATQCVMQFRIQTLDGSMKAGIWSENVISTWTNTTSTRINETTLHFLPYYPYDLHMQSPDQKGSTVISREVVSAFRSYLGQLLNGTVFFNPASYKVTYEPGTPTNQLSAEAGAANANVIEAIFDAMNQSSIKPNVVGAANPLPSLDALLSRVAEGITNSIRNNGIGSGPAIGSTWQNVVTIQVRWVWIVFPLLLECATLGFLITTIFQSRRSGAKVWKSSAIAAVFPNLGVDDPGRILTIAEIEESAKKTRALHDGWKFVISHAKSN